MKIARVFPKRTNMSPTDLDCYFSVPPCFIPKYDEIHISVVFTWDITYAEFLKKQWEQVCSIVKIGGPAFNDSGGEFTPGLYTKQGITITSRGCPNNCSFCFVPKREGKIRELEIKEGNIIQDNNFLACSKQHRDKVFEMLKNKRAISFVGGLEPARITDEIVEQLRGLKIKDLWLAYDMPASDRFLEKAVNKLSKYFKRDKIRCYILIGYEGDTVEKAEARCRRAWEIGVLPFAQRYRIDSRDYKNSFLQKSKEWQDLARTWSRPAATKSHIKKTILKSFIEKWRDKIKRGGGEMNAEEEFNEFRKTLDNITRLLKANRREENKKREFPYKPKRNKKGWYKLV